MASAVKSDTSPALTVDDAMDGERGYSVSPRQTSLRRFSGLPRLADGLDLYGLQFGLNVLFPRSEDDPFFPGRIAHVVGVGADKKVFNIAAGGVVAAVADFHAMTDFSIEQRPNEPVNAPDLALKACNPVAARAAITTPFQAISQGMNPTHTYGIGVNMDQHFRRGNSLPLNHFSSVVDHEHVFAVHSEKLSRSYN